MAETDLNQVEKLFHAVVDLPDEERAAYLAEACNGDERLKAEVNSLISAFDNDESFIDKPALELGLSVLSRSSGETLIGETVGPYKIVSQLGKGGMGEVYLAEDTKLERKVALKFISPEMVDDKWAKRRLVKEAQASAMLDHPSICPVYDIQEWEGHMFIVMQYVEGETLAGVIGKSSLGSEQVITLGRQIVSALAEAHAHGIIHRDIKPRNIMVTSGGHIKVLDFGLAKSMTPKPLDSRDDSVSNLMEQGIVPGTIRYMSPEQLCNEKLDYRSDIFSLGTVLYEMASGTNPFQRKTGPEVVSAILSSTPKPLTQNGNGRARQLETIIERCLAKDRNERYQSASELLLDLDKMERGEALPRSWRSYFSLRAGLLLAILLVAVVGIALIFAAMADDRQSVAVLQITCQGSSSEPCLGPAITQQLTEQLSRRSDFIVRNVDPESAPASPDLTLQTIGQQLGVNAVLSGSIVRRGNSSVLKTRLTSVPDGATLAENEYVVPSQTVPMLEAISIRLALNPDTPLTEDEKQAYRELAALLNRNPEAMELYLRGLYYWNKRDKQNVQKAIEFFEQALDIDPVYAPAYSGLANCYVVMSSVAYGTLSTKDAMEKAAAAAKTALEIDPRLAEAHTSLGIVQMKYNWNWPEAEKSFKRAIELKPDSAQAHYWYANLLITTGRMEEAIDSSERAKSIDPLSPLFITNLGRAYYRARKYDQAIEYFLDVLQHKPNNTSAMYVLAHVYFQKGRYDEAIVLLQNISKSNKWLAAAPLGYALAKTGRTAEAKQILSEMEALPKTENLPAQERAIVYIGLGDKDAAFQWLEKSYEEKFAAIISLPTEPIFDDLRSDPQFVSMAKKLKLNPN
jgi:serine/threonine-protein kinase